MRLTVQEPETMRPFSTRTKFLLDIPCHADIVSKAAYGFHDAHRTCYRIATKLTSGSGLDLLKGEYAASTNNVVPQSRKKSSKLA